MESFQFSFGPPGAPKRPEAPLVVAVVADLSGSPGEPLPPLAHRRCLEIDIGNFDDRMAALKPRVSFRVPNTLTGQGHLDIETAFRRMDGFSPAALVAAVDVLTRLWTARRRLARMEAEPDGRHATDRPSVEELLGEVLDDPALFQGLIPAADRPAAGPTQGATAAQPSPLSELDRLLGKEPSGPSAPPPPSPVQALFDQAVAHTPRISDRAVQNIHALVERIDEKLAEQLCRVLHHPHWQGLEATWRGLHYLVSNTETDGTLKIRILSVSKRELAALFGAQGESDNPLSLLARNESIGCLLADFYFGPGPEDVAILGGLSEVAAAVGAPLLTGAAPSLLELDSWRHLRVTPQLVGRLDGEAHRRWQRLRRSRLWPRVALILPRFLARLPYGARTNPAEGIEFEERVGVSHPGDFLWANAAYAMGVVMTRAFSAHGWEARLAAGSEDCEVDGLPCFPYTDEHGDSQLMPPTEVAIPLEDGVALARCGLTPLLHKRHTDCALFVRVPRLRNRDVARDS